MVCYSGIILFCWINWKSLDPIAIYYSVVWLAGFEIYYSVTEILFLDLPGIFGFVLGPTGNPIHVCNSRKVKLTWASE